MDKPIFINITQCCRPLKISVTSATPHAYCGYGVGRPLCHAGTGGVRVVVGRHVRRIFARDAASRSRLNVFLGEKRRQRRGRSRSHSEQHLHMRGFSSLTHESKSPHDIRTKRVNKRAVEGGSVVRKRGTARLAHAARCGLGEQPQLEVTLKFLAQGGIIRNPAAAAFVRLPQPFHVLHLNLVDAKATSGGTRGGGDGARRCGVGCRLVY